MNWLVHIYSRWCSLDLRENDCHHALSALPQQYDPNGAHQLAKKPNYDFEKRKKESEKKMKQEEKRRRKRESSTREADASESLAPDEESVIQPE